MQRNLIKSASLNNQHIYSRWALVQILTELPQILGGNKYDAQDYCHEILKISKDHGLLSYHYFHSFQRNEKKIIEFEKNNVQGLCKILVRKDSPRIAQELIWHLVLWISNSTTLVSLFQTALTQAQPSNNAMVTL